LRLSLSSSLLLASVLAIYSCPGRCFPHTAHCQEPTVDRLILQYLQRKQARKLDRLQPRPRHSFPHPEPPSRYACRETPRILEWFIIADPGERLRPSSSDIAANDRGNE
jgi:hypothetical protein